MDRIGADFTMSVGTIRDRLGANAIPIQLPIGAESNFKGIIDIVRMKAIFYDEASKGQKFEVAEIPEEHMDAAKAARDKLLEAVADVDEKLMEKYLGGEAFEEAELKAAIRLGTISMKFFPALCGSAFKNKGVQALLDAVVDYLPSPLDVPSVKGFEPGIKIEKDAEPTIERKADPDAPFSGIAFKIITDPYVGVLTYVRVYSGTMVSGSSVLNTTRGVRERIGRLLRVHADKREEVKEIKAGDIGAVVGLREAITGDTLCDEDNPVVLESIFAPDPVISVAIEPKTKADEQKMGLALMKLAKEDPSLKVSVDQESGQTIISGMGELHLDVIKERMLRESKVETTVGKPQVAFRETILSSCEMEGKYIKQTGGRGQYGHVQLRVEPRPPGSGFEFVDEVKGGVIPKEYIKPVAQGVEEALKGGVAAGYPLIDIRVTLFYGSYHEVDSNEMAFKIAGSMAVKDACRKAGIQILEPIMQLEVVCPDDFISNVVGDLNRRRARILGMEPRGGGQAVKAEAPLMEMFGYSTDLRSGTQGRGAFTMEYKHYAAVPNHVAETLKK
jgi:elongation factor G